MRIANLIQDDITIKGEFFTTPNVPEYTGGSYSRILLSLYSRTKIGKANQPKLAVDSVGAQYNQNHII